MGRWTKIAKKKFKKGNRIKLSICGLNTLKPTEKFIKRAGTVTGFSKLPYCVRVRWDGNKGSSQSTYHMDFVELI